MSDEYPGIGEFRRVFSKSFPDDHPNYVALEGFVDARVLTGALERAGRTLDRDSFARALESMKNVDVGIGRPVSYASSSHVALTGVYLSRLGTDGVFRTFTP
jgi:ABC-type branched-subunit amino acid transport system substrate-binding protein